MQWIYFQDAVIEKRGILLTNGRKNKKNVAAVERGTQELVCVMFSLEVNKACLCLAKGPIPQRWESVEEPNLEQLLIRLEEEQQR